MQVPVFFVYNYLVMSLITLLLYAVDKWKAKKSSQRIPEKVLHLSELLGGWPGGILGQLFFRHKCSKLSYQLVFWAIVAIHLFLWYLQLRK
ncbi:DUF1294 domain-containing protein [Lentisphaera marina]|uniref:DUF1294 domain-containing protein n=1 Tax=Lentisphaera marina TaxID=1111041 RepID=UPI0023672A48|nr:DUF1294 domain-containing protein [Lentisphaera marina]MDD7984849.1 DUF1294 domain-containing protein [Lentisphaera marina]